MRTSRLNKQPHTLSHSPAHTVVALHHGVRPLSRRLTALPSRTRDLQCSLRVVMQALEVAAQGLQSHPLLVDLIGSPEAQGTQDRNGRAPALNRVLEQKASHEHGQRHPAAVVDEAQRQSSESQARGIRLDRALDVPFAVQFPQAGRDAGGMPREAADPIFGTLPDTAVGASTAVSWNPSTGGGCGCHAHEMPKSRPWFRNPPKLLATGVCQWLSTCC